MGTSEALVERDEQLRTLREVVADSDTSGSVVLLSGEAGFGKTSLLKVLLDGLDHGYRVLTAACEPLGIPAAFAPLFELLDDLPAELRNDIRSGSGRPAVYAGMLDLVKNDRVILILEDMHWSDEATLGLVRYLGKRVNATNSCLIITFRSEELDLSHPLRLVIADLGHTARRIELPALTPSGVRKMAHGHDVDPIKVHAATLGNPFFVEEVIRHPDLKLPPTIGNAVLAIAGQLPSPTLEILYTVALSPEGVNLGFLTDLGVEVGRNLDKAVQRRLLVSVGEQVTCRHDLIRESLMNAVPPAMKRSIHGRLLNFLEDTAGDSPDIARLAYHSVGAGAADKALFYSLKAARDASGSGAHRQAAFHYSNALEFRAAMSGTTLQDTLLEAAKEHLLVNAFEVALNLARQRMDLTVTPVERARARAWVSYFESRQNNLAACRREAELALDGLKEEAPSVEFALAMSVLAWVAMTEADYEDSVAYGDQAVIAARAVGSVEIEVFASTTAGTSRCPLGDLAGIAQLKEAARLGTAFGAEEFTARALNNLGFTYLWALRLESARRWYGEAIEYTTSRELDAWYIASRTTLSSINVASGRWEEADHDLELVLGQRTCLQTEIEALIVAATLRARRGDPGSTEIIEQTLARITNYDDLVVAVTGNALAMEGAWLGALPESRASEFYQKVRQSEGLCNDEWGRARLAFWAQRLGFDPPDGHIPGPAGLEWEGKIEAAAQQWEELGFPVEAALTRAIVPGADLDSVFSSLTGLGAEGVARGLRRELQRRGVKGIPRGERPATKRNPAGLTSRQVEVLALMTTGLSNAAIAEELFISEKTAVHHVSAILAKLGVSNRSQAAAKASAGGWPNIRS